MVRQDVKSRWEKLCSQMVNLPSGWPLMKPASTLHFNSYQGVHKLCSFCAETLFDDAKFLCLHVNIHVTSVSHNINFIKLL